MLDIYLVEDSELIRDNLASTLVELLSARIVGSAGSESAAIAGLTTHPELWNLAIVDIFLKPGSGLNVLARIQGRGAHQKVAVLTNYASQEVRRECLRMGADVVFDKSTDIEALISYCKSLNLMVH